MKNAKGVGLKNKLKKGCQSKKELQLITPRASKRGHFIVHKLTIIGGV